MFDPALERLDREALGAHQWRRIRALGAEVLGRNRFYTAKWRAVGVERAEDLRSWDDFRRLPFTRKGELVADQAAQPPYGTNLTYPVARYVRLHQTSGTTGAPLRWLDTEDTWRWWIECWQYTYAAAGLTPEDRVFFPFSFGPFVGFWSAFDGARAFGALVIAGGGQDSVARLATLAANRATVLVCTPSYGLHLLALARERGLDSSGLPVRVTIHAGEPGAGIPAVRARLEQGWGARAYDHAGMTEVGAWGYECAEQAGLHVNEADFVAEVIDPATAEPALEGELVLTNLGRGAAPAIRYRTGDRVRVASEPCGCGRTFLRLADGLLGRLDDMLIVRGVNVFPAAIEAVVRRFPAVDEFQIEVWHRGDLAEVRLLAELDEPGRAPAVREALALALGLRIDVVPVPPRSLPRSELKARRLVRRQPDGRPELSAPSPPGA
jgi:phenylacetate-CoA ligase